jgi:hypothetical protein
MAQAVSCWPVAAEGRVRARVGPCGVCGGQIGTVTGFFPSFRYSLSVSFHRVSPHSYITWGISSSETLSQSIKMNSYTNMCSTCNGDAACILCGRS